jgi:hypothetical protein
MRIYGLLNVRLEHGNRPDDSAPRSRGTGVPESCQKSPSENERAQGMPGASCAPVASRAKIKSTRVSPPQVRRTSRHSLRYGFNGFLRGLPGEPGFLATVPAQCEALSRVDTSVGVSGRHDFSVCDTRSRQSRASHPSHPAPNVRDDRDTPLISGTGRAEKCI